MHIIRWYFICSCHTNAMTVSESSQKTDFTAIRKVADSMTSLILSIFIWFAVGMITANLAKQRGRDPYMWFFIGMLLGIFGILVLYLLPIVKPGEDTGEAKSEVIIVEEVPQEPVQLFHLKDWHCIDTAKEQKGPLTFRELKSLWSEGKLLPQSYVWTEGMLVWQPIEKIPNLKEALEE